MFVLGTDEFLNIAKQKVVLQYNRKEKESIGIDDVYVVWVVKVLQHNKALLSTNVAGDGKYYECTYNGDKHELYLDDYTKQENICIEL